MAEEKRKRNERFVSPKGRFIYPWLSTPDTKFDEKGVYRLKLAIPAAEAADVIDKLMAAYDANVAEALLKEITEEGSKPWELDEETNEYRLTFKMKAVVTTKAGDTWTQRPSIFDSSGVPCADLKIGGGTIGRISYEIIPYANKMIGAGISLRLKAVQIIDLVTFGSSDAGDFGFAEEEGYASAPTESPLDTEQAEGAGETYDF